MPSRERVQAFVDRVLANDHVAAIEDFYHEDATMRENQTRPRGPRSALVESERRMLARHEAVVSHIVPPFFIDGDEVVIHWIFEFSRRDGSILRLEEVARQTWRGERIAAETFFYDPAQFSG
jgi:ketosteroid isomerase-like protein